jgi:EmrB/QacA subfamily drug resistance transporter
VLTAPEHRAALDSRLKSVGAVVVVGIVMTSLDTTIVAVALQTLSEALGASLDTIQWVATAYLLALATSIPLSGWAAERFGPRRVWMGALTLFGAGSALCALSWSAESLIAFRVLQGLGGGIVVPVGMTLLAQAAGPARFGRVTTLVGAPLLLGPVFGPVIGGLVVELGSWRWMFTVNLPFTVTALALASRVLAPGGGSRAAGRLDWVGLALLSPGLASVVFGLARAQAQGTIVDAWALGPVVAGLALIACFGLHARRAVRPIVDIGLLRTPSFGLASAVVFLGNGAFFAAWLILPLYLQLARGFSPLEAGALLAAQGVGVGVTMPFAGRLTERIGGARVVLIGVGVSIAGNLPLAWLSASTPLPLLEAVLLVRGCGFGLTFMPAMAAAYSGLRPAQVPRATAILTVAQRIGGAASAALVAALMERRIGVAPGAGAFSAAFRWLVVMLAVAAPCAALLALHSTGGDDEGVAPPPALEP